MHPGVGAGRKVKSRTKLALVRERFFSPRLRVKSLRRTERLAAGPVRGVCPGKGPATSGAKRDQTVWSVFEAERPSLVPYRRPLRRLPRQSRHRCPRPASSDLITIKLLGIRRSAVGRPVEVRAYAERIELRQNGRDRRRARARNFGRDGDGLRSRGTTFRCWRANLGRFATARRSRIGCSRPGMERDPPQAGWVAPDGDRQMVSIFGCGAERRPDPSVDAACA